MGCRAAFLVAGRAVHVSSQHKHAINQPTNQSINRSIDQSINQLINQSINQASQQPTARTAHCTASLRATSLSLQGTPKVETARVVSHVPTQHKHVPDGMTIDSCESEGAQHLIPPPLPLRLPLCSPPAAAAAVVLR